MLAFFGNHPVSVKSFSYIRYYSYKQIMKLKGTNFPKLFKLPAPITLAILACLLYIPTLSFEYTQDDAIVLSENVFTQKGIKGIPGLWKHDTFFGFFQDEGKANLVAGGRYRPFTPTLFALEGALFGFSPLVGHLFNILWYGLLIGLIYVFLWRIISPKRQKAEWALWGSLLFLAHPIHTEVVCNIKGRDEIVAFAACLAAMLVLWKSRKILNYALSFAFFFIAMASKENAAVFLAIGPGLLYLKGKKKTAKSLLLVLFSGFALYMLIRFLVLGDLFSGEPPKELMNNPFMVWNGSQYELLSFFERIPTVFLGLLTYVKLMIWPWPLTHDYYPLQIPIISYSDYRFLLSLLLFLSLTVWSFARLKSKNIASWGWLWFAMALFPMSNILINVGTFLSERFLFIPSLGFILFLMYILKKYAGQWLPKKINWTYVWAAILGMYCFFVFLRMPAWQSNFTLFTTDVVTSSESAKVNNAAAGEYNRLAGEASSAVEQKKWAQKAQPFSKKAIELHPTYKNAFLQKGNTEFYLENYEKAINAYEKCLSLDPNYEDAKANLLLAFRSAGQYYGEQKQDMQNALRYLTKAYNMKPTDYETLRLMGVAYGLSGRANRAVQFFKKALKHQPNSAQAYYNLGAAYMQAGRADSSQIMMQKAREMDPGLFNSKSN
jgi:tetratricopeptide (TPR) repeat protein